MAKPAKTKTTASRSRESAEHRRKVFAEAYLANGGNGMAAAVKAGYSAKTAAQQANRLLRMHPEIKQAIEERRDGVCQKMGLTTERVLREVERIAFFDPRKLFKPDGSIRNIHELDDDTAAVIAGLDVAEEFDPVRGEDGARVLNGYLKKIKLWDKLGALDKSMRYLGLLKERVEHTGKDGGPMQMQMQIVSSAEALRAKIRGVNA